MPLSKQKQADWMREYRQRQKTEGHRYNVIPNSIVPLYNPAKHKPGDKVRMLDGRVAVIPNLDADGNPIPD